MACPACSAPRSIARADLGVSITECRQCGAIFGSCYLGDSYAIVRPHFAPATFDEAAAREAGRIRYFDLECLGSRGLERRHGWFDTESRLVVQVG